MATTPDILYIGQPGATDTTLYTVPSGKKTTITSIRAVNTNAATKYFTIHIKQNGDSIANDVAWIYQCSLNGSDDVGGGGIYDEQSPIPLNTVGDIISGIQETATAITVTIIGFEEDV